MPFEIYQTRAGAASRASQLIPARIRKQRSSGRRRSPSVRAAVSTTRAYASSTSGASSPNTAVGPPRLRARPSTRAASASSQPWQRTSPRNAEVPALADAFQVAMLRPRVASALEAEAGARLSARGHQRAEGLVDVRLDHRWHVVVVGGEDAARAQQPGGLPEHRPRLHPVEGLGAGDEVGTLRGEPGVGGESFDEPHIGRFGGRARSVEHPRVRLYADDLVRLVGPDPRRQPRAGAEVDHQPRPGDLGQVQEDVEEGGRRRGPVLVVDVREALELVARPRDHLARELAHPPMLDRLANVAGW